MQRFWQFLGYMLLTGAVGFLLWKSVPRVVADLMYRDGFMPAETARATQIRCKSWGGFFANNCTVTYLLRGDTAAHEIEDFSFGGVSDGPYRLLQHRDMPARVTTDISLDTVWNRLAFAVTFAGFGVALTAMGAAAAVRRMRPHG